VVTDWRRREFYDGRALASELARLLAIPDAARSGTDKRDLHFLAELDSLSLPSATVGPDGQPPQWRWRDVDYVQHRHFGRRYAHGPSHQLCSKGLRYKLGSAKNHDVDSVNQDPTVLLNEAIKLGIPTPMIKEYVTARDTVLSSIADFYGLTDAKMCKFAVLIAMHGGCAKKLARAVDCPLNAMEVAPELHELEDEFAKVRTCMLDVRYKSKTDELLGLLRPLAMLRLENALARSIGLVKEAGASGVELAAAQAAIDYAKMKATTSALRRSCFSHIMQNLENKMVQIVDNTFRARGWTVGVIVFDGLMVELRDDAANLGEAMRSAETAVKDGMGYTFFALAEKPFADTTATERAAQGVLAEYAGQAGDE